MIHQIEEEWKDPFLEKYGDTFMQEESPPIVIQEGDIPLIYTPQGEIVCFPQNYECLNLGVCGRKRTCKTLTAAGFIDRLKWYGKKKHIAIINDGGDEWLTHSYGNNVKFMKTKLKVFGEEPRGLPLVFLYPSFEDTIIPEKYDATFNMAIPWEEFIDRPDDFSNQPLGKSVRFFNEIKEELRKANDPGEVEAAVDSCSSKQAKGKLLGILKYVIEKKLFDISSNMAPMTCKKSITDITIHNLNTRKKKDMNAFLGFMSLGLIPCLMTNQLKGQPEYKQLFVHYLKKILECNLPGGMLYGQDEEIHTFADELQGIQSKENQNFLASLVTQGFQKKVALHWSTQNISKLYGPLKDNTKYIIAAQQAPADADELGNRFGLTTSEINRLKRLSKKKFEVAALSDEDYKVYDTNTGKVYSDSGPFFGKPFFPLSRPSPVGKRKELSSSSSMTRAWLLRNRYSVLNVNDHTERYFETQGKSYKKNYWWKIHLPSFRIEDNLQQEYFGKAELKNIEITYEELNKKGFKIASVPIRLLPHGNWRTRQQVQYIIVPSNWAPPRPSIRIIDALPKDTQIILDPLNKRVRLYGENCGEDMFGEWVNIN